jgi:hypothetical protein
VEFVGEEEGPGAEADGLVDIIVVPNVDAPELVDAKFVDCVLVVVMEEDE